MKYLTAIVHKDADSAFGLTFPDLPGCFAASDTWDGIPAAAAEALDLWFQDQAEVVPASLDEVRARPEVAAEIGQGAILMPVPYIPADSTPERVNVSIERGLLRAIDQVAKERNMTRSSFLASAARREIRGAA